MSTAINAARLKALHSLGLAKDYKNPAHLTKSQKDRVNKLTRQYSNILDYRSEYVAKDVSSFSKKAQEKFKQAGYTIINNKMYVRKEGFKEADIKWQPGELEKVKDSKTGKEKWIAKPQASIVRKTPGQVKQSMPIFENKRAAMDWRDNLIQQYQEMGFKNGDYIGVRFFNNSMIQTRVFTDMEDLLKYLELDIQLDTHHTAASHQELMESAHLVRLSVSNQRALAAAEHERARRQKQVSNTARSSRRRLGLEKHKKK